MAVITIINPANEETEGNYSLMDRNQVASIIDNMNYAQKNWAATYLI